MIPLSKSSLCDCVETEELIDHTYCTNSRGGSEQEKTKTVPVPPLPWYIFCHLFCRVYTPFHHTPDTFYTLVSNMVRYLEAFSKICEHFLIEWKDRAPRLTFLTDFIEEISNFGFIAELLQRAEGPRSGAPYLRKYGNP